MTKAGLLSPRCQSRRVFPASARFDSLRRLSHRRCAIRDAARHPVFHSRGDRLSQKGQPMRHTPHIGSALLLAGGLLLGLPGHAGAANQRSAFVSQQTAAIEGIGEYTSMALDQLGRAHVAYFDRVREVLVYAFQTQAGWRTELVDGEGQVGWYASLALDSHGNARIAYYDVTRGALKYAARTGGAWSTVVVDASARGAGHYCSLSLDANDDPAISYYDASALALRYASLVNGSWQAETVDGAGNAAETEQAIDRADRTSRAPAISQDVPNVGHYTSLVLDRRGVPHIAYQDITHTDLKVAVKQDGRWLSETVDAAGDVGEYTSLKLDAAGNAVVSYYDLQHGALKLARQQSDGWHTETVDGSGDVGAYSSLALDDAGGAHVSYLDAQRQTLKYASEADGGWLGGAGGGGAVRGGPAGRRRRGGGPGTVARGVAAPLQGRRPERLVRDPVTGGERGAESPRPRRTPRADAAAGRARGGPPGDRLGRSRRRRAPRRQRGLLPGQPLRRPGVTAQAGRAALSAAPALAPPSSGAPQAHALALRKG